MGFARGSPLDGGQAGKVRPCNTPGLTFLCCTINPCALRVQDVFDTEAWFENLEAHGLAQPPVAVHSIKLHQVGTGRLAGSVHLMRPDRRSPLLALSNYYSSLFEPVFLGHLGEDVDWSELTRQIKRLPGASVIRLQPLDADGIFIRGMESGLRACGYSVDRFFCFGNWYLPCKAGTFDAYWQQRPAKLRNTVERAKRRLDRSHVWQVEILTEASPALEAGVAAYQRVYDQSWKEPEPNPDFMPGLIRMSARHGTLRLGLLRLDGEVVAAQVWIVAAGKANIYKLAYQSGFERFSVGSVLTAALMQHVMDVDGVQEVDYLTGDDAYKQDWMSHRRERVGLIAFDRSRLGGLIAWVKHRAGKLYRRCATKFSSRTNLSA